MPKRLQAEQFIDALSTLSGQWQNSRAFQRLDGRKQGGQIGAVNGVLAEYAPKLAPHAVGKPPAPVWIWDHHAATSAPLETIYLRKTITLTEVVKSAPTIATCDNEFTLFVNGQRVIESKNWAVPAKFDLAKHLRPERNVIAVQATNIAAGAAGFILRAKLGDTWLLTDDTWLATKQKHANWHTPNFETQGWKHAAISGAAGRAPWNLGAAFDAPTVVGAELTEVRAVLSRLDPLQLALGRPNRDQIVTTRDTLPTLLQALELTNGTTRQHLKAAATKWLQDEPNPVAMANAIYQTALADYRTTPNARSHRT